MILNQDSITVNMVVRIKTAKYLVSNVLNEPIEPPETSIENIQKLIASGDFTAEYIPSNFTSQSTGTLLITEKQ